MNSRRRLLLFSFSSLLVGFGLSSVLWLSSTKAQLGPAPVIERSDWIESSEFKDLLGRRITPDRFITKFHGTKLNLISQFADIDRDAFIESARIVPLKDGGLLVSFAESLYRFDASLKKVWKNEEIQQIIDFTVVESTGTIYGTAGDNTMFILDAINGNSLFRNSRNGKASYGVAVNYGDDMALVTDNLVLYREGLRTDPMMDSVTCWRGTTVLWEQKLPPDSELVVRNDRIFALTRTPTSIYVKEILPPNNSGTNQ